MQTPTKDQDLPKPYNHCTKTYQPARQIYRASRSGARQEASSIMSRARRGVSLQMYPKPSAIIPIIKPSTHYQ